jgi:hypothetical protein
MWYVSNSWPLRTYAYNQLQQERTRLGLTSAVKAPAEGIRKGG